ncbi:MAG: hypothetical protein IPM66_14705 [Acidobacteriota bacterium]|nr:MAG: hypothetical protein IPM66_14455 [Acidobacteriota bacterium]QQS45200.1 MAG: hypothetical protein IPM66_14705 [Acidobacteriota bacterium]
MAFIPMTRLWKRESKNELRHSFIERWTVFRAARFAQGTGNKSSGVIEFMYKFDSTITVGMKMSAGFSW